MRENEKHQIEVHVSGICFDNEGKVLIAKRDVSRNLYPDMWECGGGQVHPGENFEDAVKRQLQEELGAVVEPVRVLGSYTIDIPLEPQKKIPGICAR